MLRYPETDEEARALVELEARKAEVRAGRNFARM